MVKGRQIREGKNDHLDIVSFDFFHLDSSILLRRSLARMLLVEGMTVQIVGWLRKLGVEGNIVGDFRRYCFGLYVEKFR